MSAKTCKLPASIASKKTCHCGEMCRSPCVDPWAKKISDKNKLDVCDINRRNADYLPSASNESFSERKYDSQIVKTNVLFDRKRSRWLQSFPLINSGFVKWNRRNKIGMQREAATARLEVDSNFTVVHKTSRFICCGKLFIHLIKHVTIIEARRWSLYFYCVINYRLDLSIFKKEALIVCQNVNTQDTRDYSVITRAARNRSDNSSKLKMQILKCWINR